MGAPLAAWLLKDYGWRSMFLILGAGGLVWLAPWLMLERNDDRALERSEGRKAVSSPFAALFRTRIMWGTLIGTFCYNYFVYFSMTWLPAYLVERRHLSMQ